MTELQHILTHAYKDEMVTFLATHPEHFGEAITLALSDEQPYAWRAAWLLFDCMEKNDARVRKHINTIIRTIPERADGHQREFLKILLRMELSEAQEARLFDVCMTMWEDIAKSPSVRFTAFRFIVKTAEKYPELQNELTALTQDWYLDTLSPGIRRSIKRMIPGRSNEQR
ncbi:MAG: hypothetical protein RRA94_06985 [Bacteroidota bacterium]|nr:hypothetical protein [Bacteroidota bacterium]